MREKSNVVLVFWPSTTLSAKLSLAAAASTDFQVLNVATSQGWQYDVDKAGGLHDVNVFGNLGPEL